MCHRDVTPMQIFCRGRAGGRWSSGLMTCGPSRKRWPAFQSAAEWGEGEAPKAACFLENVFQSELDQAWGDGRLGDNPEDCSAENRPRISELRMVKRVVELRAESQRRVFAEPAHRGRLANGDIGIELSGPGDDALTRVSIS